MTAGPGMLENLLARWAGLITRGRLTVAFPNLGERRYGATDAEVHASVRINDPRIALRMLTSGDIGLAEGYIEGEWDTADLSALLALGQLNDKALEGTLSVAWPLRFVNRLRHALNANSKRGSRRNIAAHYDLGNDFYGQWLDETMSYSAAVFAYSEEDLAEAQRRKYRRLADRLGLCPGDRVLEIGCGWGGFAEIAAAEYGCSLVGLTLSKEQAAFARQRLSRAGFSDAVEVRIQDYRDVSEQFDHIVSIEMFEAVGEDNWKDYFAVLNRCLKPGGRGGLQIITIDDAAFPRYRRNPDFIQRYIFPGGMLPSLSKLKEAIESAGLTLSESYSLGRDYAETLRRWDRAFLENWRKISTLGFDERFRRLWHYYLCYCEVGFDSGHLNVGQFIVEQR